MSKTNLIHIYLGSIALHLAVLSILVVVPKNLIQTNEIYFTDVSVSRAQFGKPQRKKISSSNFTSGATSEVSSHPENLSNEVVSKLRRIIEQRLERNLDRSMKGELVVAMTFSQEGISKKHEILKGSGNQFLDESVLRILSSTDLNAIPKLANMRIQIPIRLL